ncbi:hypothetical protein EJ02DRAFT_483367 [Clathrospora elynae]|uniref:Uncharacterized protein n=1 Tax=Clathrospora elynae TaxID=706981 RepID=A0A6A5SBI9_9PLEO|nr:hypothetical protein EJ02DRAFT_483367 [Clathrospora elynae]
MLRVHGAEDELHNGDMHLLEERIDIDDMLAMRAASKIADGELGEENDSLDEGKYLVDQYTEDEPDDGSDNEYERDEGETEDEVQTSDSDDMEFDEYRGLCCFRGIVSIVFLDYQQSRDCDLRRL